MFQVGQFILASKMLDEDFCAGAKIMLVDHQQSGSIGFIINRESGRHLNELNEFQHCPAISLYEGGPMGQDHLYMLHQRPDLIQGGTKISEGQYWGGRMEDLVMALTSQTIRSGQFTLFLGYCGWNEGELQSETDEGYWLPA
jgi:putative transcriptional regulator